MGLMVVVKQWLRNRREARFHSQKGRVSYPPGKERRFARRNAAIPQVKRIYGAGSIPGNATE
jgi:hypothetical protein